MCTLLYAFSSFKQEILYPFLCTPTVIVHAMHSHEGMLTSTYLGPSGTQEILNLSCLLVSLSSLVITIPSWIIKMQRQSRSKQD